MGPTNIRGPVIILTDWSKVQMLTYYAIVANIYLIGSSESACIFFPLI